MSVEKIIGVVLAVVGVVIVLLCFQYLPDNPWRFGYLAGGIFIGMSYKYLFPEKNVIRHRIK